MYKLVVFYDPDCDVCRHAKEGLRSDPAVNAAVASGKLKVLAVYTDGDREVWQRSKDDLPDNWISAYDPDGTVDRDEVYVLRATPTLYLIGPDNTVVIKDGRVGEWRRGRGGDDGGRRRYLMRSGLESTVKSSIFAQRK